MITNKFIAKNQTKRCLKPIFNKNVYLLILPLICIITGNASFKQLNLEKDSTGVI
jgi:hypothetical protein